MRFCLCVRICLYFAIFMLVFLKFILLDFTMYMYYVYVYRNDLYLQKSKPFAFELSEQIIKMFYICSKPVDCWTKYR